VQTLRIRGSATKAREIRRVSFLNTALHGLSDTTGLSRGVFMFAATTFP
jgi:hypothetical protein